MSEKNQNNNQESSFSLPTFSPLTSKGGGMWGLGMGDIQTTVPVEDSFGLSEDEIIQHCSTAFSGDSINDCISTVKSYQRELKPWAETIDLFKDTYEKGIDFDLQGGGLFNINPKNKSMEWSTTF